MAIVDKKCATCNVTTKYNFTSSTSGKPILQRVFLPELDYWDEVEKLADAEFIGDFVEDQTYFKYNQSSYVG